MKTVKALYVEPFSLFLCSYNHKKTKQKNSQLGSYVKTDISMFQNNRSFSRCGIIQQGSVRKSLYLCRLTQPHPCAHTGLFWLFMKES